MIRGPRGAAGDGRSGHSGGGGGNLPALAAGTAAAGVSPSPLPIAAPQIKATHASTDAGSHSAPPPPGMQYLVPDHFFREVPPPLPASAEEQLFAEGRVFEHLKELTVEIGHRQVGDRQLREGL